MEQKVVPVSLLMSLYIKEKKQFLQECLNSIQNQTNLPKEVLIVFDGPISKENEILVEDFKNSYPESVKIIALEKNQGLGAALAIGVTSCSQPIIARMDTDDIMLSNRIEDEYQQFLKNPKLDIVGSNIDEFSGLMTNILGSRIVPETDEEIRNFSKRRNPFNHMTVMYKKKAVLDAGNYQPLPGFEDYYLWVRMLKNGCKGYNIQKSLILARTGEDMYKRRGGIHYLVPGLKARKQIYKAGLGSLPDFVFVSLVHICISLMPNGLRGWFYEKKLRNS